jgi:hypothetical protein
MKKLIALAAVAGITTSGAVMAAVDGDVGADSTGSVDITLVIPPLVQIVIGGDVDLGTYDAASPGDITQTASACVRTNGVATYDITATSTLGGGTALQMTDGTNFIPYSLSWDGVALAHATLNDNGGAGFARDNAGPGFSACTPVADRISVTATDADMVAADAGSYTDTVELLVAPH